MENLKLVAVKNKNYVISTTEDTKFEDFFVDFNHNCVYRNENENIVINKQTFPNISKVILMHEDIKLPKDVAKDIIENGGWISLRKITEFTNPELYNNVGWGDGKDQFQIVPNI